MMTTRAGDIVAVLRRLWSGVFPVDGGQGVLRHLGGAQDEHDTDPRPFCTRTSSTSSTNTGCRS